MEATKKIQLATTTVLNKKREINKGIYMNTLEVGFNFKNDKGEIIYPKQGFFIL